MAARRKFYARETTITIIGDVTRPQLRFTAAGATVANFNAAITGQIS